MGQLGFGIADDRQIADLVLSAQRRLVVVVPAVARIVGEPICDAPRGGMRLIRVAPDRQKSGMTATRSRTRAEGRWTGSIG